MVATALEVNSLRKSYPLWRQEDVIALQDVSFSINEGEVVGLLGPNGAGKTTAIKCICGLIIPDKGSITFFEQNSNNPAEHVSAVLEGNRNIYWRLTARENLEFFAGLQGRSGVESEIRSILERFSLNKKENTPARKLSRGMQQKLALGCALIRGTNLLLLDEPTLGLDVKTSRDLRRYILKLASKEGKTILLSSHDMNVVEDVCERVIIINNGKVMADDKVDNLKDLFNIHIYKFTLKGRYKLDDIEENFDISESKYINGKTRFKVALKSSDSFYRLIDELQKSEIRLEKVQNLDSHLEEIFMNIIENDGGSVT